MLKSYSANRRGSSVRVSILFQSPLEFERAQSVPTVSCSKSPGDVHSRCRTEIGRGGGPDGDVLPPRVRPAFNGTEDPHIEGPGTQTAGEQLLPGLNVVPAVRLRSAKVKTPKMEFKDGVMFNKAIFACTIFGDEGEDKDKSRELVGMAWMAAEKEGRVQNRERTDDVLVDQFYYRAGSRLTRFLQVGHALVMPSCVASATNCPAASRPRVPSHYVVPSRKSSHRHVVLSHPLVPSRCVVQSSQPPA
jgi:hypothetical protein